MTKMKSHDLTLALERVKQQFPVEAEAIRSHIDGLEGEDTLVALVREMIEAKAKGVAAQEKTDATLQAWKPVMDAVAMAISKIATEEKRRNDIEERKLNLQAEDRRSIVDKLFAPVVAAVCSIAGTAAAFYFST